MTSESPASTLQRGFDRVDQSVESHGSGLVAASRAVQFTHFGIPFMNVFFIIFGVILLLAFVMIAATSGVMAFNISRLFNRLASQAENADAAHAEKKRRALDIVAKQPPGAPAFKCKACGATVDSTAELSADGKVRCNYCNQWTSIYQ